MKIKGIIDALERLAPLPLQEDYDNAGLQVGTTDMCGMPALENTEVTSVLVCLDVTEATVDEAVRLGCNMIVSHHPLLFHSLRTVSGSTWQQRCVVKAIRNGISIYSAHTNLDNADGGVNHRIASLIGLRDLQWLEPGIAVDGVAAGSGLIGTLPEAEDADSFLARIKELFGAGCVMHTDASGPIRRVALCGGAGSFLISKAREAGADCFITGEMSYHNFFEGGNMMLVALGHYESERFTQDLLKEYIGNNCPGVDVKITSSVTSPVRYR